MITTSLSVFVFELHLETTQNVEELDERNLDLIPLIQKGKCKVIYKWAHLSLDMTPKPCRFWNKLIHINFWKKILTEGWIRNSILYVRVLSSPGISLLNPVACQRIKNAKGTKSHKQMHGYNRFRYVASISCWYLSSWDTNNKSNVTFNTQV